MDRTKLEQTLRPLVGGLVILVTLIVLLGTAVRDPRPHDIAVGMVAPQPVADQLAQGFAQNAPGAFKFTTYATDADARTAVDKRDVVAALIVGQTGPTLVVAGAAGEAIAGGVTAAFTNVFAAQGQTLNAVTVHPFGTGDPHGIVLFFLLLATLISSVLVGALAALTAPDRRWTRIATIVIAYAICAGIVGALTASWIANDYGDGIMGLMAVLALFSAAIGLMIAALARLFGAIGVGLGVLFVVLLGLVSSGGPLGSSFLPDAYRLIAPWLPVEPAFSAMRGVLYFGGAGIGTSVAVLAAWAMGGLVVLWASTLVSPVRMHKAVPYPA